MATFVSVSTLAVEPTISDVVVRQRWPWSRHVDIDYVLTCDSTQRMDVALAAYEGDTPLTIPVMEALSGDVFGVARGARRMVFDPMKTEYTNQPLSRFKAMLTPSPSPVYMIVDLTNAPGSLASVEYIYPGDGRLVTEGRHTNVWFDVTNDPAYATDRLVLRRVSAGTVLMNPSANTPVTLTRDFYAGVFEVTQRQWELIMGNTPSKFNNSAYYATRPVETVSYESIRGAADGTPPINWPATGTAVATNSFLGKLRQLTGLSTFDLPTEAQWAHLCRAGTSTLYNDGDAGVNFDGDNAMTNAWMELLGRYKYNGGLVNGITAAPANSAPEYGTALVGSYQANAWGVYDTHANVFEWCRDWYTNTLVSAIDPEGPLTGATRSLRSGTLVYQPALCVASTRSYAAPGAGGYTSGFRIVVLLP